MKNKLFLLLLLLFVHGLSAPFKKWRQTPSGLYYKVYTSDTSKPKPEYGDHIWMHLRKYGWNKKELFNTMIFDTRSGVEMDFRKADKPSDITEIFQFMGKGDSAVVMIPASIADSNGSRNKYYMFRLVLMDFQRREDHIKYKATQIENQIKTDSSAIADFLSKSDIKGFLADENGNWYFRKSLGLGKKIIESDSVVIHYVGKLLNNRQFDNSYERKQPFSFVVGKRQVIDGLDKGIRNFSFGDKGTLLIPSINAYGDKEAGKIPPNSVLIFEIEILQ